MIRIFYGDDRVRAKKEIERILGNDYEIIDGVDLELDALPTLFLGASLLTPARKILIRDLSVNKLAFEKLPEYLDSPHEIIIFELKLDKRSATYKAVKDKIECKEFVLPKNPNLGLVFNIYNTAKNDGKKAVEMLEKIKQEEEPMMFFGLMVSQALDMQLKSSPVEPWLLIKAFLLRLTKLF